LLLFNTFKAPNGLLCADVPLRNYSLTHHPSQSESRQTAGGRGPGGLGPNWGLGLREISLFEFSSKKCGVLCIFIAEELYLRPETGTRGLN